VSAPGRSGKSAEAAPGEPEVWLSAFRTAVHAQKQIFADHRDIEARSEYEGIGEGGDRTLVIDRLCEDTVFAELERLHADGLEFTAISEERGTVTFGDPAAPTRIVIDPIDGSLNARRTVPCHSLSVAVAEGESMADVTLGYVYEFGASEEFVAVAGHGATRDGATMTVPPGDGLEVVALEASKPERVQAAAAALAGNAFRLRSPGSIAVSASYVAAGRFDGMFSTRPTRSVDAAAAQLLVREAGGHLSFGGELSESSLGLDARYGFAAARTEADLDVLLQAQDAVP
jgi:myo-inositol-1(or 4)-monophosphatase